ncbi:MAG: hypothetical protein KDD58_08125, partial [Bdellovibrionales bacterium]|nr:hypothetical protein [Bdellovibrionales bacterium]
MQWKNWLLILMIFSLASCASQKIFKYEKIDEFQMNKEYEEMVKVEKEPEAIKKTKPLEVTKEPDTKVESKKGIAKKEKKKKSK